MRELKYTVESAEYEKMRLDKFLARKINNCSRNRIQKLIKQGNVEVSNINKKSIKPAYSLKLGDTISVKIPRQNSSEIKPWQFNLEVIYEDNELAVINKPAPLVMHPAPSHEGKTLVSALLTNFNRLSRAAGKDRPGIVHRLDKGTTGALVIAKTDKAYYHLKKQFKNRKVKKVYRAIVLGTPEHKKARIEAPIGRDPHNRTKLKVRPHKGKKAISEYEVIHSYRGFSLVEVNLKTGRTHQIRVHFSFIGHPILGDEKYKGKGNLDLNISRPLLHSLKLGFEHPIKSCWKVYEAPLPEDFLEIKNHLENL